jgi:hypothetical protein
MFQHRVERFSNNRERNTSSVCDILQHLNWCSFEDRHRNALLVMMYKIANENVVITKKDRLKTTLETIRQHALHVPLPFTKTNVLHYDLKKDAINEFGIKY